MRDDAPARVLHVGKFDNPKDPIRTHRGRLGPAAEFQSLPPLGPATSVEPDDRAARAPSPGVISR